MTKRRKGIWGHSISQVPSLKQLAQHAVDLQSGRRVVRPWGRKMGDTAMTEASGKSGADESSGQQQHAYMIPGVDGRLQFAFPQKIVTILRYYEVHDLTSSNGAIATQVYRMNSVFDPDFTNIGHQPLYFDTYAGIYQSYKILGSRLTAEFSPTPTADNGTFGPYLIGINGSPDSTALSAVFSTRMEQSDGISHIMNQQQGPRTLTWNYSPMTKLDRHDDDDTVSAAVTANPTQQYFAHVWAADTNGPATSIIPVRICVEYTVEFFKLNQAAQS